jgi:hypothetical protein
MTRKIDYTSFTKVRTITDMTIDSIPFGLEITYGSNQQRVKNIFKENGATTKTKYYAPGYEKEVTSSGTWELYYVNCPYGLVAINIRKNGADSTYYVDSDHLGSILALIRNNGSQAAEYSFDEWGRRRRPSNWSLYDSIPDLGFTVRGYTGHEHYDQFGLIEMLSAEGILSIGAKSREPHDAGNGRVYDPVIGRFLSPDPVIQAPDFTQNYNGYSYCINNPFKYIDPTGFERKSYNISKIDPMFFEEFLNSLAHGGSLYDGVKSYSHVSQICYYDDETQLFEFSYNWYSIGGQPTQNTNQGYLLSDVNIMSQKMIFHLSHKDFGKIVDPIDYYKKTANTSPRNNRYGNPTFGVVIGAASGIIKGAATGLELVKDISQATGTITGVGETTISIVSGEDEKRLGNTIRDVYNLVFVCTDIVPYAGLFLSVLDNEGLFESDYHRWDVYEDTGYWVYYDFYSKKFKKIKLR